MSETGELVAKLEELWRAGAVYLPLAAGVYAQASQNLNNSARDEARGFVHQKVDLGSRPQVAGILRAAVKGLGPVFPHIQELRDVLQTVVADTAESLSAAGTALVQISDAYAAEDTEVADELNRERGERLNTPELRLPTTMPEIRRPGDPFDAPAVQAP